MNTNNTKRDPLGGYDPALVAAVQAYENCLKVQDDAAWKFNTASLTFKSAPTPANLAAMNEKAAVLLLAAQSTENAKTAMEALRKDQLGF